MFIKENCLSPTAGKNLICKITLGKLVLDAKDGEMSCFLLISLLGCFTVAAVTAI
jgi:hypothetical protein